MEPKRLAANRGWIWIKQGYALFMKAPLLWIVLFLICVTAIVVITNIPVVGEPLVSLLMPVVLVGLMTGCRALQLGDELELANLFSGFHKQTTQLVTLGGISLVSQFLIFGLMMLAGGSDLVSILSSGQQNVDPDVMVQALNGAGLAIVLGVTLFSLLVMSMQYAPLLVYFDEVTPLQAMKFSLLAFTHNIGPMLVYGVTFIFLAILASLPVMLGWVILLPLIFTSLYASYADIFPISKPGKDVPRPDDVFRSDEKTF